MTMIKIIIIIITIIITTTATTIIIIIVIHQCKRMKTDSVFFGFLPEENVILMEVSFAADELSKKLRRQRVSQRCPKLPDLLMHQAPSVAHHLPTRWKVTINRWNKCVFNGRPKLAMLSSGSRRSLLSAFQMVGPITANSRSQMAKNSLQRAGLQTVRFGCGQVDNNVGHEMERELRCLDRVLIIKSNQIY